MRAADDRYRKMQYLKEQLFSWPKRAVQTLARMACNLLPRPSKALDTAADDVDVDATAARSSGSDAAACSGISDRMQEYACCLRNVLGSMSMSTAFSGMDCPATALAMISGAVTEMAGEPSQPAAAPTNMWAVEWVGCAQEELAHHPAGPSCIYGDMNNFWLESVASRLEGITRERRCVKVLKELVKAGVTSKRTAYCLAHGKTCGAGEADLHMGGTPCTDFSARGDRDGLEGPTTWALMCWVGQRRDLQEPYWLQENVCEFPAGFLHDMLSDLYEVQACTIDPAEMGWPVVRRRQYIVGRHRQKTAGFHMPFQTFVNQLILGCRAEAQSSGADGLPPWDAFFVATEEELADELAWAASRPSSNVPVDEDGMHVTPSPSDHNAFASCLTDMEVDFKRGYEAICRNRCYSLCQNPRYSATMSSDTHLHTILKSAGVIWSDFHQRWLSAGEALLAQGVPIYSELTGGTPMSSFAEPAESTWTRRSGRGATIGMAGNGMHATWNG